MVSALTLEGTELVTSGPLGRGLEASADEDETGLDPSGVPDDPVVETAVLEASGVPDGPVLEAIVVEASVVPDGATVL